jgi:hypothetical protein
MRAASVVLSAAGWGERAAREVCWACVEIVFVSIRLCDRLNYALWLRDAYSAIGAQWDAHRNTSS